MSPIARRNQPAANPQEEGVKGEQLIQNLKGLARGIPDYARLADMPLAY